MLFKKEKTPEDDIKKLSKAELLEAMIEQMRVIDSLRAKNKRLTKELSECRKELKQAASLQIIMNRLEKLEGSLVIKGENALKEEKVFPSSSERLEVPEKNISEIKTEVTSADADEESEAEELTDEELANEKLEEELDPDAHPEDEAEDMSQSKKRNDYVDVRDDEQNVISDASVEKDNDISNTQEQMEPPEDKEEVHSDEEEISEDSGQGEGKTDNAKESAKQKSKATASSSSRKKEGSMTKDDAIQSGDAQSGT